MIKVSPYKECLPLQNKIIRLLWEIFRLIFFCPFSGPFFREWRIIMLRLWGAKIGKKSTVKSSVKVFQPWKLELGDYTVIDSNTRVYNVDKIHIGTKSVVSQNSFLCTASHDYTKWENPLITAPIIIGNRCWVAADAFVGMGVTVGEGAIVGARACVFKSVPPWTVVGGNPAKFIKNRMIQDEL